jgi:ATP-binding cassette subfamily B protein
LVGQLQAPFVNLSGVMPQYVAMLASAERLMELESIQGQQAPAGEEPQALYHRMDAIGAGALSFSYDRDPVLQQAEFSLPKGAFAAITGPSGVGKSTLLKLLLGIFRPESGGLFLQCGDEQIRLDRATRKLFAYVPQGNLLLSGTLLENLTITRPDATREEIEEALFVSAMDEYLPQLPDGLNTVIGESAAGLSEGQAQRIAVARALLRPGKILLLDEFSSALDAQTETLLLERLTATRSDRTMIFITHRERVIDYCDATLTLLREE